MAKPPKDKKNPFKNKPSLKLISEGKEYYVNVEKALSPESWKNGLPLFSRHPIIVTISYLLAVGLSGFLVNYYNTNIRSTKERAVFETRMEEKIKVLESEIDKLTHKKANIEKEIIQKQKKLESQQLNGYIGSIGTAIPKDKKSSFDVDYYLDLHICEINTQYKGWEKLNLMPPFGCFFEIKNVVGNYKTWAMVIGTFNDPDHSKRAMLVSPVVSELLVPKKKCIRISGLFRRMTKTEVLQNKECIQALERYSLDISEVF